MSAESLQRFRTAQAEREHGYAAALAEIRSTGKRTHWIWYVFPQLVGLGQSSLARHYAIAGRAEARAYLEDSLLCRRLLEITTAIADRLARGSSLLELLGSSVDAQKVVSSLTLFERISRELQSEESNTECAALATVSQRVLATAAAQGYVRCAFTERALGE